MSIFPKHQPIQFEQYLPNECRAEEYDFQSLAEQGDYGTFQVNVNPCSGAQNVIPNPTFDPSESVEPNWEWTVTGGFAQPGSGACKGNDGSSASLFKDDIFVIGRAYQITVTMSSLNGALQIYNGTTLIYTIYNLGVTTFSFIATDTSVNISFDDPQNYGCIDSITALAFSPNMAFGIIDENGDTAFVATFDNNPEFFTFVENTVTIRFLWSDLGLSNGCYRIGFADGCTNTNAQFGIFNQTFDSQETGWQVNEIGPIDIEFLNLENPLSGDLEPAVQATEALMVGSIVSTVTALTVGQCYEITIEPDYINDADGLLRVYCGTSFVEFFLDGIDPLTKQITCTGNGTFTIEFEMNTSTIMAIFGFNVTLCDTADFEFDYMSQSFKLADDHPCTHLISMTCNQNALNYVFVGSGFEPNVRLRSELYNIAPEEIRLSYHENTGYKKLVYGEVRFHFFFVVDMMPAWLLHFFPYYCRLANNFYIDGDLYFIEGETPTPEWATDITNFGTVRIEVSENPQMNRNANLNTSGCQTPVLNDATCDELNDEDSGLTVTQKDSLYFIKGLKTGQTVQYESGDDGTNEFGRGVSFNQLTCNNWFGNTNRFTATDGTQVLVDDLMLDWQTQTMFYVIPFGTVATWNLAVSGALASTQAGYNDWTLPNIIQLTSLINYGMSDTLNYSPLGISSTPYANIWSSTTNPNATTEAYRINPVNGNVNGLAKATAGVYYIICRHFTKDDLGL